ncbi:MAG TPA: arylsulfotransferase family protein [Thermoleophilaceae bacterium]|nr:arylsulfotransferase family protein [Thermoleophilaceae bacterium]
MLISTRTPPLSRRAVTARRALLAVPVVALGVSAAVVIPGLGDEPYSLQRYKSRPDLRPPKVEIVKGHAAAGNGYIFVAPKNGPGPAGPMILDRRGRVVWFKHLPKRITAFDFKPARLNGKPVLTWWEGRSNKGKGAGEDVIADSSYRELLRVPMKRGLRANLHEFTLTPRGTALALAYNRRPADLRPVGGPRDGRAVEGVIQEIDVHTGRVVFEWHSLDHVPVGASYKEFEDKARHGYDYFHLNSVEEDAHGNLLLSARHTNAVYLIDRDTGKVRWRLGGKRSTFAMGAGTRFVAQHDARFGPNGAISIYDNQAPPDTDRESRAVLIGLDHRARRARLIREYEHPRGVHSDSQGSAQFLPGRNLFVGWGGESPFFSEFDFHGRLIFDARFRPSGTNSYRAYLMPWRGTPRRRPAIEVRHHGRDGLRAYASWNGSTEVRAWELLGGPGVGRLHRVAVRRRTGFETELKLGRRPEIVAVRALGAGGKPLRQSRDVRVR